MGAGSTGGPIGSATVPAGGTPDNRLVADVLETDGNGRLRELREAEEQVERMCREEGKLLDERMRGS